MKFIYSFGKRSDRLPADEFLHQCVPDHKVGSAFVFINEQQFGSGVHRLEDIRSLRGRTRGMFGRKMPGIAARKPGDERRNVKIFDTSAVFSRNGHS